MSDRINEFHPTDITCYTDGSKTEAGTGFGYIITTNNNKTEIAQGHAKLPDHCSVYQAELCAITSAANSLTPHSGDNIIFLTDSLSSIQTLKNNLLKSRTAIETHKALTTLASQNNVTIIWVPGHEGHDGNEMADKLAKKGTTSDNLHPGHIPQSTIKYAINETVSNQDKIHWIKSANTHTKTTMGNLDSSQHKQTLKNLKKLQTNRSGFRTATHLITGHAGLNYHLHKMTVIDSPICPSCEIEEETVSHFLGQCPAHALTRMEFFNTFYDSLLNIFKHNNILNIVKFANKTGRFQREEIIHTTGVT